MSERRVEFEGQKEHGPCSCCGGSSRAVWGYTYLGDEPESAYFVHWTIGKVSIHGAHFDLVIGMWGDDTTKADRVAVSLEFRRTVLRRAALELGRDL